MYPTHRHSLDVTASSRRGRRNIHAADHQGLVLDGSGRRRQQRQKLLTGEHKLSEQKVWQSVLFLQRQDGG